MACCEYNKMEGADAWARGEVKKKVKYFSSGEYEPRWIPVCRRVLSATQGANELETVLLWMGPGELREATTVCTGGTMSRAVATASGATASASVTYAPSTSSTPLALAPPHLSPGKKLSRKRSKNQ